MKRPVCRNCGRPLVKTSVPIDVATGEPVPPVVRGRKVIEILSDREAKFQFTGKRPHRMVGVWLGDWGAYGDGFFCTRTCGHRYAVSVLRRAVDK